VLRVSGIVDEKAIAEALGKTVTWDEETMTVDII